MFYSKSILIQLYHLKYCNYTSPLVRAYSSFAVEYNYNNLWVFYNLSQYIYTPDFCKWNGQKKLIIFKVD